MAGAAERDADPCHSRRHCGQSPARRSGMARIDRAAIKRQNRNLELNIEAPGCRILRNAHTGWIAVWHAQEQHQIGARGGLLREIGEFEILALKDFGSILSMRAEAKAEILAALREIYDGAWTRHLGSDGGKSLSWKGKLGLLFCATPIINSHYGVIGAMGDRFLLSRLAPAHEGQFERALQHAGAATGLMRKELAEAVAQLFTQALPERGLMCSSIDAGPRTFPVLVPQRTRG